MLATGLQDLKRLQIFFYSDQLQADLMRVHQKELPFDGRTCNPRLRGQLHEERVSLCRSLQFNHSPTLTKAKVSFSKGKNCYFKCQLEMNVFQGHFANLHNCWRSRFLRWLRNSWLETELEREREKSNKHAKFRAGINHNVWPCDPRVDNCLCHSTHHPCIGHLWQKKFAEGSKRAWSSVTLFQKDTRQNWNKLISKPSKGQ